MCRAVDFSPGLPAFKKVSDECSSSEEARKTVSARRYRISVLLWINERVGLLTLCGTKEFAAKVQARTWSGIEPREPIFSTLCNTSDIRITQTRGVERALFTLRNFAFPVGRQPLSQEGGKRRRLQNCSEELRASHRTMYETEQHHRHLRGRKCDSRIGSPD